MDKGTNTISFRMGHGSVDELLGIYKHHLAAFRYNDEHEQLLAAHLADMYLRLETANKSNCKTIRLCMTISEALAFWQYWNVTDTSAFPYATILICDMIKRIDKRSKDKISPTVRTKGKLGILN